MRWVAVAALALVGCSGDEETNEEGPLCSELGEACHDVAEGDVEAEECHEIGHAADEAACEAELDRCLTVCAGG